MKKIKIDSTPTEYFQTLPKDLKNLCYFTSSSKEGWETFIAYNPIEVFEYKIGESNKNFEKFYKKNLANNHKLVGFFSYDLGHQIQELKQRNKKHLNTPDIYFMAFDKYYTFNKTDKFKVSQKRNSTKGNIFTPSISGKKYKANHKKIKNYIKNGDIYQINYTHLLQAKTKLSNREVFLNIRRDNPVEYLSYIETPKFTILSASPENFIKVRKNVISTSPIKGTRARHKNLQKDLDSKNDLLGNTKEKAELNMITDLLRNDLGKFCEIGSVRVKHKRKIKKCPTVWHTFSTIEGKLRKGSDPLKNIMSMLPGGSISGCPKRRAMEIIDELEPTKRGIYTGCIGVIDSLSEIDMSVGIRTIVKIKDRLYLQVGGGIVFDSQEKAEFEETLDKAASFQNILE